MRVARCRAGIKQRRRTSMTETFVAIIVIMVALLVALGAAVGIVAAFTAWRDWQRERASWNCEAGRGHRLEGASQHPKTALLKGRPAQARSAQKRGPGRDLQRRDPAAGEGVSA